MQHSAGAPCCCPQPLTASLAIDGLANQYCSPYVSSKVNGVTVRNPAVKGKSILIY